MQTPPPAPRALKYIWAGTLTAVVGVTVVLEIVRPDHPAGAGLLRIIETLWCAAVADHQQGRQQQSPTLAHPLPPLGLLD